MRRTFFVAMLIASPAAAQTPAAAPPPQDVPAAYQLRVAGPTYFTNGDVKGASATNFTLKFGQPLTVYVTSGPTLCDVRTPVAGTDLPPSLTGYGRHVLRAGAKPGEIRYSKQPWLSGQTLKELEGAAFGWSLRLVPLREQDGALVIEALWIRQRSGSKLAWIALDHQGPTTLTLRPGGRVLLDRLAAPAAAGCDAIGLGLEVGLEPSRSAPIVETEVWLVHRTPDGKETSDKQVLRTTLGRSNSWVFPKGMLGQDLIGEVSPVDRDGTLELKTGNPDTRAIVRVKPHGPAEVIAFPLTTIQVYDAKLGAPGEHAFSLRIRSRKIE